MSSLNRSLFTIAHDANEHFLKLYEQSVTTVGLVNKDAICMDCLITGIRIVAIRRHDPADTVTIAVGSKDRGEVAHLFDIEMARLSSMDLLRVMEERFARAPQGKED